MTCHEKLDFFKELSEETILIGNEDHKELYLDAAIGYDAVGNRVIYDYDLLVEIISKQNNWTNDEAIDWIEYNIIGSLPNFGEKAPIIMVNVEESYGRKD